MTSAILYQGPSVLDGSPIMLIATGIRMPTRRPSKKANAKTGDMVQTYIIRSDMSPLRALKVRADNAICGDCAHRGVLPTARGQKMPEDRSCYVQIGQGPMSVWRAYRRRRYSAMAPQELREIVRVTGQAIRVGTYGDPTAIPAHVWCELLGRRTRHTGYTHQWRWRSLPSSVLMASVDSPAQALEAQARGFRTFRVRPLGDLTLMPGEIECPASDRAGKRTTCENCGLCNGKRGADDRRRNISIESHGSLKRRFAVVQ